MIISRYAFQKVNKNAHFIHLPGAKLLMKRFYSQTQRQLKPKLELVRDFIADCLYNSEYGYFNKHVQILQPPETIPFTAFRDQQDYYDHLSGMVRMSQSNPSKKPIGHSANSIYYRTRGSFAPLWQTPSELFRPHYGQSIARFLLSKRDPKERVSPAEETVSFYLLLVNYLRNWTGKW